MHTKTSPIVGPERLHQWLWESQVPFAAFANASASLSKCLSAAGVSSICLRRASSVSVNCNQPFSRIDVIRACNVAGDPSSLCAIMSRTDSRFLVCVARATNSKYPLFERIERGKCRQTAQCLGQLQESQLYISRTCHCLRTVEDRQLKIGARGTTCRRVMIRSIINMDLLQCLAYVCISGRSLGL